MKTFKDFFNEEYDYRNVDTPTSRKYLPKQDNKNSYLTSITQPSGGNTTFTPNECEEESKTNKKINKRRKNDRNRTVNRSKNKVHISRKRS